MKKGLLFFLGLFVASLANNAIAQDFDYNMGPLSKSTITAALTNSGTTLVGGNVKLSVFKPSGASLPYNYPAKGSEATGSATDGNYKKGVSQGGIKLYIPNDAANQFAPQDNGDDGNGGTTHGYLRMSSNGKYFMIMESETGIKQLSVVVGAASATQVGTLYIKYGTLPPDLSLPENVGFEDIVMSIWEGSLKEVKTSEVSSILYPGTVSNISVADAIDMDNNPAPTKYIRIYSAVPTGQSNPFQTKLFRIAASKEPFTLLPLDFLSFTAKTNALKNAVNLNWQTTNEVNTKEFVIERRSDITEFTAIDTKVSNNTAGIHNYSFVDNNVNPGNLYYRLKQVDNDGKYRYSDIAQVNISGGIAFSIYPNPSDDILNVTHEAASTKSSVKVLSLDGKTVVTKAVSNNVTATSLSLAGLSTGTYVLIYDNDGKQSALKFIKR